MFAIGNKTAGIGVDIEDIGRFEGLDAENNAHFLNKIFTEKELNHCFATGVPAQHLAVRYAGKEAIVKALSALGRARLGYKEIEILGDDRGIPGASIQKEGFNNVRIHLSLSHSQETATAFTIVTLETGKQP